MFWNCFRRIFFEICSCFKSKEDFYQALYDYGKKLKSENIIYAEVLFSPWRHVSRGIKLDVLAEGLISAVEDLKKKENFIVKLICDFVRHPMEDYNSFLDWVLDLPRRHCAAIGISGGTGALPRKNYKKLCMKAKKCDLKIVSHAGELEGPGSIQEAIEYLHSDRISHGVNVLKYPQLTENMKIKDMHFELCPTANKILGVGEPEYISIKNMIKMGMNYSINTDDELIFNTNIIKEMTILLRCNIIGVEDIIPMQLNALKSSFLEGSLKEIYISKYYNMSNVLWK